MIGSPTYLDILVLVLLVLSGILSLYRGLTRELLAVASWGAGAGVGLLIWMYQKQLAQDLASQLGANATLVHGVLVFVAFLVVLIIVHLLTARISDAILESRVGMVDRVLGFGFGLVRGFVLVLIPFMFHEAFLPPESQLPWMREAQVAPLMKSTGDTLKTILNIYVPSPLTEPDEAQQG